jgi:hypothetical protein
MAFRTGRVTPAADNVVRRNSAELAAATLALANWRAEVAGGALRAATAREAYQLLLSARNGVAARIAQPGLALQYQQLFGLTPDRDPVAEWASAAAAIEAFRTWFAQSWPWRTVEGYPAFERGQANGELTSLVITVGGATQAAILAQIDAVLAAIE